MDAVLCHYGIKGMHWGVRRYQYPDPDRRWTPAGKERYGRDGDGRHHTRSYQPSSRTRHYQNDDSGNSHININKYSSDRMHNAESVSSGVRKAANAAITKVRGTPENIKKAVDKKLNKTKRAIDKKVSEAKEKVSNFYEKNKDTIKKAAIIAGATALAAMTIHTAKNVIEQGEAYLRKNKIYESIAHNKKINEYARQREIGMKTIENLMEDRYIPKDTFVTNLGSNPLGPQYERMWGNSNKKDIGFYNSFFAETLRRRNIKGIENTLTALANNSSNPEEAKKLIKSLGTNAKSRDKFMNLVKGQEGADDIESLISQYVKKQPKLFRSNYKTTRRGLAAGYISGADAFKEFWETASDAEKSDMLSKAKFASHRTRQARSDVKPIYDRFTQALDKYNTGKMSKREFDDVLFKDGYKLFNNSLTYDYADKIDIINGKQVATGEKWGGSDRFNSILKKRGYDAILDLNDQTMSRFKADSPLIWIGGRDNTMLALESINEFDWKKEGPDSAYGKLRAAKSSGYWVKNSIKKRALDITNGDSDYAEWYMKNRRRVRNLKK